MTLIVASVAAEAGWIISDTLITGGPIQLRDREYQIKCIPAKDKKSLVAFSGDAHNGAKLIEEAAATPSGLATIDLLRASQAENPTIDFLYMFLDANTPRLFKISNGTSNELTATYIGEQDAFEQFQEIRHATEIDPVPKSLETFFFGTRAPSKIPDAVSADTATMARLLLRRPERDVGGWAVPYVLTKEGVYMCGYAHAVSDPIFEMIGQGDVVPHGTAEAGGYGLAVTELGDLEGMVIYRRQMPGGLILIRQASDYKSIRIEGTPAEFRARAYDLIGKPVDVIFGDNQIESPDSVTILRDEQGQPAVAIASRGKDFSIAVLNVATAFRTKGALDFIGAQKGPKSVTIKNLSLTLADDRNEVTLKLSAEGRVTGESTLNASEMDAVITALGEFRSAMKDPVSPEPDQSGGSREFLVPDPAWRTNQSPHSEIDGIVMRLRHLGFGWVSFLLPRHEARALGDWLTKNWGKPTG